MSLQLTFGGAEAVLVRDTGTANAVQGFVSEEIVVSKNVTALPTNFLFQLYEYIQAPLVSITGTVAWIKVSGIWKQAIVWLNVGGIWKQTTPFIKVGGVWK